MKRVVSACLRQTLRFETEEDYNTYIKKLQRKRIGYKIYEKQAQPDSSILVKLARKYIDYSTGDYLN